MNDLTVEKLDIVQRYRQSHHAVAQMFAMGCTAGFIRQHTGRSQRSLTLLWNDPAFQELIAQYRLRTEEKLTVAQDTFTDLAVSNMLRSEQMISDQLDKAEEEEREISLLTLDRIAQGRADRFGYGKHQTVQHNHDFAALLDRAIDRSGKRAEVIDVEAAPIPPQESQSLLRLGAPVAQTSGPALSAPQPKSKPSFVGVLSKDLRRRRVA